MNCEAWRNGLGNYEARLAWVWNPQIYVSWWIINRRRSPPHPISHQSQSDDGSVLESGQTNKLTSLPLRRARPCSPCSQYAQIQSLLATRQYLGRPRRVVFDNWLRLSRLRWFCCHSKRQHSSVEAGQVNTRANDLEWEAVRCFVHTYFVHTSVLEANELDGGQEMVASHSGKVTGACASGPCGYLPFTVRALKWNSWRS